MNQTYLRGDMYYADLGQGIGSEQEGYRPVVIIQNNVGNKHSPTVIIASVTSKTDAKPKLPTHYYINAEDGLELPSIVLLEQLRTVDKRRLGDFIGHLSDKHIRGINHALAVSIGLIESIPKKLILCLCSACADNFYGSGAYSLRRIDPQQTEKDTCTYCNQRTGYDYEIIPKTDRRLPMESQTAYKLLFADYPDVVNVEQMREMLGGICDKTAYRLLRSGEIRSFIVGRRYRIPKLNILEYLELIDKSNA